MLGVLRVTTPEALENAHPDWREILDWAADELRHKSVAIDRHRRYYKGDHPRVWLTEKLRSMFKTMVDQMVDNWCKLVVDAPLVRTRITGWAALQKKQPATPAPTPPELGGPQSADPIQAADVVNNTEAAVKDTQADEFKKLWEDNDLEVDQIDLWRRVRRDGEAFTVAWKKDPVSGDPDTVTIVDSRTVAWPRADGCSRADPPYVVRLWLDDLDMQWRSTVYWDDGTVFRLVGPLDSQQGDEYVPSSNDFTFDEEDPGGDTGFDRCPVIRWAMEEEPCSVLEIVEPAQDRINKLEANKMVAAEFAAFAQRIFLTKQEMEDGDVEMRPDRAIVLDPGEAGEHPTQVITASPTDLAIYDNAIDKEVDKLFSLAMLPRHLNAGQNVRIPSGDAAQADEGPFTEMIQQFQEVMGACATELARLFGYEVAPIWRNPVPRPDDQKGTVVTAMKNAGVPLEMALKKYADWTDEEIDELVNKPMTMQQALGHIGNISQSAALGGLDPAQAASMTQALVDKHGLGKVAGPPSSPKPGYGVVPTGAQGG